MPKGIYIKTEEHKRKLSEATKKNPVRYWLGKKLPEETRKKMSKFQKGRKHTEEEKRKRSEKMKNHKVSEETRKKISCSRKGNKHWNWKGGMSYEIYPVDWTDDLRESIRKRDSYICQICEIHQDELTGWHKQLSIHHIDYNKDNLNPNNLITLCVNCHTKTNFNRKYWIDYFKNV